MGKTCTKTLNAQITTDVPVLWGAGCECEASFKRFYEWRL